MNNDFDFKGFVEEYQATGKYDVNAIIENLDDNGCLDEFKKQIANDIIQSLVSNSFRVGHYINVPDRVIKKILCEFEEEGIYKPLKTRG